MQASRRIPAAAFAALLLSLTVVSATPAAEGALPLSGKRVAILVGEGFHDGETFIPMAYVQNLGAKATVIGVALATHTAYNSAITAQVHRAVGDVSPADFDALIIPGGRSPDWLRQHPQVVAFARAFFETGKPTAAICHGPQVLIAADVLGGRKATCFPAVSDEIKGAGAEYHDLPVLRDGNLITSRIPDDLPKFCAEIALALQE